ncbi:8-oxoguanine DNA glycosylase [Burkholderia gladioli]|uniref:8-oxoguanine DNA glycosylase n=1 Tax=Burkholderia gladioli TaxID=28095 RepID=UPI0016406122|nr:8-oxoguanine DNA glycosylase [Burkholderia gladioli]
MPQLIFPRRRDRQPMSIPDPDDEVIPGVRWGNCADLFSPAYWRALMLQDDGVPPRYRLGENLLEETFACVLGGYGIPAEVGNSAFAALRDEGLIRVNVPAEQIALCLSKPLSVGGRQIKYRFAKTKSIVLADVAAAFQKTAPPKEPLVLREWLSSLRGIGPKTASWIVRNYTGSDEVAILDIHILRAGAYCGLFPTARSRPGEYIGLERRFLDFSRALGVRPSELDACIWAQMKRAGRPLARRIRI